MMRGDDLLVDDFLQHGEPGVTRRRHGCCGAFLPREKLWTPGFRFFRVPLALPGLIRARCFQSARIVPCPSTGKAMARRTEQGRGQAAQVLA